uniref:melanopsin-A-like n=1 Tax=Oncorhynchus gorbuscha TaxID=8017 RepID=UPI001EAEB817|nr:melanopsin-A-like [Oncorhynchus gorbuscha]
MFIINLALTDFLTCVTQTPIFFINSMHNRWIFGEKGWQSVSTSHVWVCCCVFLPEIVIAASCAPPVVHPSPVHLTLARLGLTEAELSSRPASRQVSSDVTQPHPTFSQRSKVHCSLKVKSHDSGVFEKTASQSPSDPAFFHLQHTTTLTEPEDISIPEVIGFTIVLPATLEDVRKEKSKGISGRVPSTCLNDAIPAIIVTSMEIPLMGGVCCERTAGCCAIGQCMTQLCVSFLSSSKGLYTASMVSSVCVCVTVLLPSRSSPQLGLKPGTL